MFFIADNFVKGSINSCDIDSNGKNLLNELVKPILEYTRKHSIRNQRNMNPKAKAERLIRIPANKQKEKNPIRFTK